MIASLIAGGLILINSKEKQKNASVQLLLHAVVILVYIIALSLIVWFNPLSEIADPMKAVFVTLAGCILSYAAMGLVVFISTNSDRIADRFSKK